MRVFRSLCGSSAQPQIPGNGTCVSLAPRQGMRWHPSLWAKELLSQERAILRIKAHSHATTWAKHLSFSFWSSFSSFNWSWQVFEMQLLWVTRRNHNNLMLLSWVQLCLCLLKREQLLYFLVFYSFLFFPRLFSLVPGKLFVGYGGLYCTLCCFFVLYSLHSSNPPHPCWPLLSPILLGRSCSLVSETVFWARAPTPPGGLRSPCLHGAGGRGGEGEP